jgi:hypothetical protein
MQAVARLALVVVGVGQKLIGLGRLDRVGALEDLTVTHGGNGMDLVGDLDGGLAQARARAIRIVQAEVTPAPIE